jgi:hypothetical protein
MVFGRRRRFGSQGPVFREGNLEKILAQEGEAPEDQITRVRIFRGDAVGQGQAGSPGSDGASPYLLPELSALTCL